MKDSLSVYIGPGRLAGRAVYAARDFQEGEMVKSWDLRELNQAEYDALPQNERMFVHSFWGKMYLFPEPSRYTNHSADPNTHADMGKMCDYALRPIAKGEMITTNATLEIWNELKTFVGALEGTRVSEFEWITGGYRNAAVRYMVSGKAKSLRLRRVDGNWRVVD